jgi:hypothetical protein
MMKNSILWLSALTSIALVQQALSSDVDRVAAMSGGVHFAPNVVEQFNALSTRPDALGFHIGDAPNPSRCKHWQGIVRYQSADDTPYFVISHSGNTPSIPYHLPDGVSCGELNSGDNDEPGNLVVIRMGSRDKHGERIRSNRIRSGQETADSAPHSADALVAHITFDGSGGWPNYGHPGGMQIIGDVVGVPMETPYSGFPEARILFIDVSTPEVPALVNQFDPGVPGMKAGLMGLTPQSNGKYLMLISGGDNTRIWFYESIPNDDNGTPGDASDDFTDLKAGGLDWTLLDTWTQAEDEADVGATWPTGGGAHQSLTFLREGGIDGPLYVAGARNSATVQYFGDDHIDLYRVERTGNEFKLVRAATSHKNTHPNSDGSLSLPETPLNDSPTTAHFAAGSTFYVSPTGELLLYATEHDNDGPTDSILFGGSIKAGEWRHIEMVRPGSPTRNPTALTDGPYVADEGGGVAVSGSGAPAISKAWIQFFANYNYSDRYVVVDYDDRLKDNFGDFKDLDGDILDVKFGFDDIAGSWNWYAPHGCTIRANDDSFGDGDFPGANTRTLFGEGVVRREPNLLDVCNDANATNSDGSPRDCSGENGQMDDEVTSVQFFANCDAYYAAEPVLAWDMNLDGSPETAGATATFSAAELDGPSLVNLPLYATHPFDGAAGKGFAEITIRNVAPMIQSLTLRDDLGNVIGVQPAFAIEGLDVRFDGAFTDAGKPDTHDASIDWGDGVTQQQGAFDQFADSTGGVTGRALARRVYAAGDYSIVLTVNDDDGGSSDAVTLLKVVSARDALQSVVDLIDAMIAGATDPALVKALISIRDALIGNNGGRANNGALDAYDAERLKAAFVKLLAVLDAVESAEAKLALDLTHVKNVIGLSAKSIVTTVYDDLLAQSGGASGQLSKLETMRLAIDRGNQLLAAANFRGAIDAYHSALP